MIKKLGKIASASPIPCLESPKAKQHFTHNLFEEVKFISNFISPKLAYETERASSPSLKPKPCPSSHPNVVLDVGRDSTLIIHDVCFEKENICAMDILFSVTCSYEDSNHLLILISKNFGRMVADPFVYHKFCKSRGCAVALTLPLER